MSEQGYYKSQKDVKALEDRIAELEARVQRIGELPDEWRDISRKTTEEYTNLHGCADELQSALGDEE